MNVQDCLSISFDIDQFVVLTEKGKESQFDQKLKSSWEQKMRDNCFRYTLDDVETRHIPGKYGFIAQLNIKRALERRKPQFVSSLIMPFDHEKFHFGKVDKKEILFLLEPLHWKRENSNKDSNISNKNALLINVSPLEYCNSLLVPEIDKFYPQVLNTNGLRLALETMLISYDPALKMGMNSLGAYASVNHLHFHIYYLQETLFLQYAPMKHLIGDCYEIANFPSEGFAFQLLEKENVSSTVASIMKLIEFLQSERIAHNVFLTRGKNFTDSSTTDKQIFSAIRVFVWARKSSFGSKNDTSFNPALCELAGHLPIKEKTYFMEATEEEIECILRDTCHESYMNVRQRVIKLYS